MTFKNSTLISEVKQSRVQIKLQLWINPLVDQMYPQKGVI